MRESRYILLERLKKDCSRFGARIFGFWQGFGEGAGLKNPVTEPKRSQKAKRPLPHFSKPNGCSLFLTAPTFVLPLCLAQGIAVAAENDADKTAFNLFNPVPQQLMRELQPDRPDATENPHTVDAWNVAPFNLKLGLLNNVDLQLVYDNYFHIRTQDRVTGTASQSGFGDFTTRLKINLWGNDSGQTAFALLPYVKFPTSTGHLGNNAVEGGIIFPLAVELPPEFSRTKTTMAVTRNLSPP
jgi:Putative MetA-pathway of phenol degradation